MASQVFLHFIDKRLHNIQKVGSARRVTLGQNQLGIVFTSNLKLQIKKERYIALF